MGIVRIGIYRRKPVTGLCNESAIRLCAVDLPERAKGVVKSNSGLRVYRELGRGPRGARGILPSRLLLPQRTPNTGVFLLPNNSELEAKKYGLKAKILLCWYRTLFSMEKQNNN